MPRELEGKVVVVTGAARRIGAAIAKGCANASASVVVHYRHSRAEALAVVAEIAASGSRTIAVGGDLTRPEVSDELLEATLSHFGRIDALIANASTFERTPFAELSDKQWDDGVRQNLDVAALPAMRFGRWMKEHAGGAIVTIGDSAGDRPWLGYLPYSVGKAGVLALTKGLAKELAPEVRVNAILPGPMLFPDGYDDERREREIQRTLLKRTGSAEDIVRAALFLLTHEYITGALLPVDGGRGLA